MTELKLERRFAADPQTVFSYVTEHKNIRKWWGPEGISIAEGDLDFTRKGNWSSVMVNAEGRRYKVTGEVLKSEPPHRVELSWAWHDDHDERGHESKVCFLIEDDGKGGTIFTLVHSGLADDESAANHKSGWTSSIAKLERLTA